MDTDKIRQNDSAAWRAANAECFHPLAYLVPEKSVSIRVHPWLNLPA
jgi:hypothetical protein